MLSLPRDVMIYLLCFTGREHFMRTGKKFDFDFLYRYSISDVGYSERRDALQLYCTCKDFKWLSELYFTSCRIDSFGLRLNTITIFGKQEGPQYEVDSDEKIDEAIRFVYLSDGKKVGNYACHNCDKKCFEINGKLYDYNIKKEASKQIYNQWETVDLELKHFVDEIIDKKREDRHRVMLVREKIPSNTYVIDIPVEKNEYSCGIHQVVYRAIRAHDMKFCDFCCRSNATMLCGRCKKGRYCDKECQKNHWSTHKLTCEKK